MSGLNPYIDLPARAFWRTAVAEPSCRAMTELWQPKFPVTRDDSILTAGSCFAQHLSGALVKHGYGWIDAEPGPERAPRSERRLFGYGVFSFRTGNIYTVALLRRWVEAAFAVKPLGDEAWASDGRWFDPLRPAIEPGGFASRAELTVLRATTLAAIRRALTTSTLFVYTLGLVEGWCNAATGDAYATCPGTQGGTFDPDAHQFVEYDYADIIADLEATLNLIATHNPAMRFLLTVSPVPLTATGSGHHVLVASSYAKSVLRAVAGTLQRRRADTDYFPAYEIVTNPAARCDYFEANRRSVTASGVDLVMSHFFAGIDPASAAASPSGDAIATGGIAESAAASGPSEAHAPEIVGGVGNQDDDEADVTLPCAACAKVQDDERSGAEIACEEAMLDAFAPPRTER